MTCTRERKERFILSFGKPTRATGNDAVTSMLSLYGLELFPEWAIDLMVEDCIASARSTIKRNIEYRRAYALERTRLDDLMEAAE